MNTYALALILLSAFSLNGMQKTAEISAQSTQTATTQPAAPEVRPQSPEHPAAASRVITPAARRSSSPPAVEMAAAPAPVPAKPQPVAAPIPPQPKSTAYSRAAQRLANKSADMGLLSAPVNKLAKALAGNSPTDRFFLAEQKSTPEKRKAALQELAMVDPQRFSEAVKIAASKEFEESIDTAYKLFFALIKNDIGTKTRGQVFEDYQRELARARVFYGNYLTQTKRENRQPIDMEEINPAVEAKLQEVLAKQARIAYAQFQDACDKAHETWLMVAKLQHNTFAERTILNDKWKQLLEEARTYLRLHLLLKKREVTEIIDSVELTKAIDKKLFKRRYTWAVEAMNYWFKEVGERRKKGQLDQNTWDVLTDQFVFHLEGAKELYKQWLPLRKNQKFASDAELTKRVNDDFEELKQSIAKADAEGSRIYNFRRKDEVKQGT